MRPARLAALLCFLALPRFAQDSKAVEECRERRAALRKALPDSVVVLFGRDEPPAEAHHLAFFQEPNFFYLACWNEPGAILLMEAAGEALFLPKQDERSITYSGRKLAAEDQEAPARTGFATVLPRSAFETRLREALDRSANLYTLGGSAAEKLKALAPLRDVKDARPAIAQLRIKKSPREIGLIRRSVQVTVDAHRAAWRRIAAGLYEYQLAATLVGAFLENGCERAAYPPIVGSGPNATILHYEQNTRRLEPGELVLIDAGASCAGYAADVTRTIPVSGRFTPRQRELYEVVLGALKATIAAAKPGVVLGAKATAGGLNKVAHDYIDSHGKDREGSPLGKYLPHPIAHRVGLDVHDVYQETLSAPLEVGDVLAIEPGLYLKDEGIGIRIEDMVLITEKGAELLTHALPREPAEIERALAGKSE